MLIRIWSNLLWLFCFSSIFIGHRIHLCWKCVCVCAALFLDCIAAIRCHTIPFNLYLSLFIFSLCLMWDVLPSCQLLYKRLPCSPANYRCCSSPLPTHAASEAKGKLSVVGSKMQFCSWLTKIQQHDAIIIHAITIRPVEQVWESCACFRSEKYSFLAPFVTHTTRKKATWLAMNLSCSGAQKCPKIISIQSMAYAYLASILNQNTWNKKA